MSITSLIILLIIAGICGAIGKSISGYSLGGCIVSIVVGFIGAIIGQWISNKFHLPEFFVVNVGGKDFPIVWAIIGSTIFSIIVGLLTRNKKNS